MWFAPEIRSRIILNEHGVCAQALRATQPDCRHSRLIFAKLMNVLTAIFAIAHVTYIPTHLSPFQIYPLTSIKEFNASRGK